MDSLNFVEICKLIKQRGIREFYINGELCPVKYVKFNDFPQKGEHLIIAKESCPSFILPNVPDAEFIENNLSTFVKESENVVIFTKFETTYRVIMN